MSKTRKKYSLATQQDLCACFSTWQKLACWENPKDLASTTIEVLPGVEIERDCAGLAYTDDPRLIQLKLGERCKRYLARAVLLHEMAHIDCGPRQNHGKAWRMRAMLAAHETANKPADLKDLRYFDHKDHVDGLLFYLFKLQERTGVDVTKIDTSASLAKTIDPLAFLFGGGKVKRT